MDRRALLMTCLGWLAAAAVAEQSLGQKADAIAQQALKESRESRLEDLFEEAVALAGEARKSRKPANQDLTSALQKVVSARLNLVRLAGQSDGAAEMPRFQKKVEDAWKSYQAARARIH